MCLECLEKRFFFLRFHGRILVVLTENVLFPYVPPVRQTGRSDFTRDTPKRQQHAAPPPGGAACLTPQEEEVYLTEAPALPCAARDASRLPFMAARTSSMSFACAAAESSALASALVFAAVVAAVAAFTLD